MQGDCRNHQWKVSQSLVIYQIVYELFSLTEMHSPWFTHISDGPSSSSLWPFRSWRSPPRLVTIPIFRDFFLKCYPVVCLDTTPDFLYTLVELLHNFVEILIVVFLSAKHIVNCPLGASFPCQWLDSPQIRLKIGRDLSDFCRASLEMMYSKGLQKLGIKLTKVCSAGTR